MATVPHTLPARADEASQVKRREFLATISAAILWPTAAHTQPQQRGWRVGFLHPGQAAAVKIHVSAFHEGLQVTGSPGAQDVDLIVRMAAGNMDKLRALTEELVGLNLDAVIAASPAAVRAAREVTKSLPIIAVDLESDPIASGWADSLRRPGGNVTGVFLDLPDISAKWLQLLREAVPTLSRVGVLWDPATGSAQRNAVESAAVALGVTLEIFEVSRIAEISAAFHAAARTRADGILMLSSPLFGGTSELPASLALQHRLPAITLFPQFAQRGGLLAYGPDLRLLFRQAGTLTRKVLSGTKPADLPIERPSRFKFVINLKTARLLNLRLPYTLLARGDEVIE